MSVDTDRIDVIRKKLAARGEPCDPKCPGWFICSETFRYQRCDECWHDVPEQQQLGDDDVAELPEAQKTRREDMLRAHKAGELAHLPMFEVRTASGLEGVFFDVSDANSYANELTARLGVKAWVKETP